MDQRNGSIFDHHEELFAQLADTDHTLKDYVIDSRELLEMTGSLHRDEAHGSGATSVNLWGQCPPRVSESIAFPHLNSVGQCPPLLPSIMPPSMQYDMQMQLTSQLDSSSMIDNLVKSIPDDVLDGYHSLEAIKRGLMSIPEKTPMYQPVMLPDIMNQPSGHPVPLLDTMHRLSTDKCTQEYLDLLTKTSDVDFTSNNIEVRPPDHNHVWNGFSNNIDQFASFPSGLPAKTKTSSAVKPIDKNGNSPTVFNNGIGDKCRSTENFLVKGLSPSVSVESGIHTGSYDSASPISSGRTPLRSDDSISPLTSCTSPAASVRTPASPLPRTPIRTDDCFSPGRVRRPDNSPMVRTRCEETPTPSPRAVSRTPLRNEDASSPRPVPRTPMRNDDVPSPRQVSRTPLRNDEAASPRALLHTSVRSDEAQSPRPNTRTAIRPEDSISPRAPPRTPCRQEDANWADASSRLSARANDETSGRTPVRPAEVPSPRMVCRTPTQVDASPANISAPSPHSRVDASPKTLLSPNPSGSDLLPPTTPRASQLGASPRPREHETKDYSRSEPRTPDLQAGPASAPLPECSPVRTMDESLDSECAMSRSVPLPGPTRKPRKRRKTDSMCVPSPKKRCKKKQLSAPMYESCVSGADSGIKLKIKLTAPAPQKRRRRRTGGANDDDTDTKSKKKGRRPPMSPSEQSPWGRDLPVPVLEQIFKMVVDDLGCVPSLVRFSSVCRLWNTVANTTELWQNVDLSSPCIKQKCKIDRYFRWLMENRLGTLRDLNLNGWKFSNLPMVLSLIGTHCSDVDTIGLSGWQGLHFEHLRSLLQDCPRLSRIDLSDVSPESKSTNSAVSPKSITYLTETMADRLTEINLAHNTLACLPQIISSLATHCPNLQVLDLSNIRRASHAEFALNLEELQIGCPQLRVLRITNSSITLAAVPFDQQAASPGFPALEELSIAAHQSTESLRITAVIDDDCLERMVRNAVKLRLLDVRGCTRITESSLVRVPAWDIQHLFLSGCLVTRQSGSGLELIAQKWSHSLVEMDLAWASVAEDLKAAMLALAERGPESPLRVLNLCGSAIEAEPVRTLLTRCPELESINLQSCRGLPRGVKRLYTRDQLPELLEMLQPSTEAPDED